MRNLSSGNFLVDQRAVWAEKLFNERDYLGALEIMLGALDHVPNWSAGWFRLGEFYEAAGDKIKAQEAWLKTIALEPSDPYGATLKLSLKGAIAPLRTLPAAFIETLFDQYANRFDPALQKRLGYCVPDLLYEAIRKQFSGEYDLCIDLGCGTGLMGQRLRGFVKQLQGYDLSRKMLDEARKKAIYDDLFKADIQAISENKIPERSVDLVTAADVFCYVGCLKKIFGTIGHWIKKDGILAFSIESHTGEEAFILSENSRFAHTKAYLIETLDSFGFRTLVLEEHTLRLDQKRPVAGLIIIAKKELGL